MLLLEERRQWDVELGDICVSVSVNVYRTLVGRDYNTASMELV